MKLTRANYSLSYVKRLWGMIRKREKKIHDLKFTIRYASQTALSSDGRLHSVPFDRNLSLLGYEEQCVVKMTFEQLREKMLEVLKND